MNYAFVRVHKRVCMHTIILLLMLKVVFYKIYLKGKIIIFIDRNYNIYDLLDKIYIQSWNILCMLMYMYIHRYFEKCTRDLCVISFYFSWFFIAYFIFVFITKEWNKKKPTNGVNDSNLRKFYQEESFRCPTMNHRVISFKQEAMLKP